MTIPETGRRWLREPLPWFLLAGAMIFLANGWWTRATDDSRVIRLTTGEVRALADRWQIQMGAPPSAEELQNLMDDYLHEEVLYREARRIGLDRDDTIVRRRLAQKMSFVMEDNIEMTTPTDAELAGFFAQHSDAYRMPPTYTFHHVYLRDTGDPTRALAVLNQLSAGADPSSVGDPFMLRRTYAEEPEDELARLFGDRFVDELGRLPVADRWQGPIASSYGLHLVRLQAKTGARVPPLAEARDRVKEDYLAEERRRANAKAFDELRARYRIVLPGEDRE